MTCCCAQGCNSTSGVTLPTDPVLRQAWIERINRQKWVPSSYSRLCYKHFLPSDFLTKPTGNRRLRRCAVPSIFCTKLKASTKTKIRPTNEHNYSETDHKEEKDKKTRTLTASTERSVQKIIGGKRKLRPLLPKIDTLAIASKGVLDNFEFAVEGMPHNASDELKDKEENLTEKSMDVANNVECITLERTADSTETTPCLEIHAEVPNEDYIVAGNTNKTSEVVLIPLTNPNDLTLADKNILRLRRMADEVHKLKAANLMLRKRLNEQQTAFLTAIFGKEDAEKMTLAKEGNVWSAETLKQIMDMRFEL